MLLMSPLISSLDCMKSAEGVKWFVISVMFGLGSQREALINSNPELMILLGVGTQTPANQVNKICSSSCPEMNMD